MSSPHSDIASRLPDVGRRVAAHLDGLDPIPRFGVVTHAAGALIRAEGVMVSVGELASLANPDGSLAGYAQCVGVDADAAMLAPFGSLEGVTTRTRVYPAGFQPSILVGPECLGALLDPFGRTMARYSAQSRFSFAAERRPLNVAPPTPAERRRVDEVMSTGVRSIDAFTTIGYGQRIGIFGKPGAGKSTLVGQIVSSAKVDVVVVGLIGERGREVGDFVDHLRANSILEKCCVVASTSDRPPQERLAGALAASTVAEYFRDQGLRGLLVVDSVTRVARAARELGLAAGEPPTRRGYPPSVFSLLPQLFERSGATQKGSITGVYTVLAEGNIEMDPVVEETRSLLDGHIILSTKLLSAGRFPPIDVLDSLSRLASHIIEKEHNAAAQRVRAMLSRCAEVELLVRIGEYREGADPETDHALAMKPKIEAFLTQPPGPGDPFDSTLRALASLST